MPDDAKARWRALAEASIGAALDTLTHRSADGFASAPLSERRTTSAPLAWRRSGAWHVAQRVDHPDPEQANRLALLDLEGGADALTIVIAGSPYSRGYGLPADVASLDSALDAIQLDLVASRLDAGAATLEATEALAALIERRRWTSAGVDLDLGFDPIGIAARSGDAPDFSALPTLLELRRRAGLVGRPLLADARAFHEGGAGAAQQLAVVMASGVAYLRHLESLGRGLDEAAGQIAFLLVADADATVSLASCRAARRLWARVEQACKLTARPLRLHAETSWRAMSRDDPWVNMMRATNGIFAAGLGGADVVTALPFSLVQGLPDESARRLARNAQRILIDESHLDAVDDAVAGSGGFEALTDELCGRAWALFQEIESEGGIVTSLGKGHLQRRIAETAATRANDIATLRAGLVGTSRFPGLETVRLGTLDLERHAEAPPAQAGLAVVRDAAPFEALKDRAAAMKTRPRAVLVPLGQPASFGARVAYAVNFLAVAGIEADMPIPGAEGGPPDLATRIKTESARTACICGSEADCAKTGEAVASALRDAGAALVFVAGTPSETASALRKAGVTDFIYDGCEALRILGSILNACEA